MRLIWTDAGYAALVNAKNNGTNNVLCQYIAIGSGTTPASKSDTALEDEIKRVDTIAGQAVDDNIIHAVMRDESKDAYAAYEVGLISDGNVLLARYAQADAILEKAAPSTGLLTVDSIFTDVDVTQVVFPSIEFANPPWGEDTQGVVERATQSEAEAGSDNTRGMSPRRVFQAIAKWLGVSAPANTYPISISGRAAVADDADHASQAESASDAARLGGKMPSDYRDAGKLNAGSVPAERVQGVAYTFDQAAVSAYNGHALSASDSVDNWPLGYSVTWPYKGNAFSQGYSSVVTFRQASNGGDSLQLIYDWSDVAGNPLNNLRFRVHGDSKSRDWTPVFTLARADQLKPDGVGLGNVTNDKQVPAAGGTFTGKINIPAGTSNGNAINYGQAEQRYRNASNLNAGTVPKARMSGTYSINISGSASKLGGQDPSYYLSTVRSNAALTSSDDLNSVSSGGWYSWIGSEPQNAPPGAGSYCHMLVTNGASQNKAQTVWQMGGADNARVWVRRYWGGIWKPWFEYAFQRDIAALFSTARDVTGSYTDGDTRYNTTGKLMLVTVGSSTNDGQLELTINGAQADFMASGGNSGVAKSVQGIVPVNGSYSASTNGSSSSIQRVKERY